MTPEQQKLLEKATRSLEAARELNHKNFPDFAASRTYYAMFYIATAFLEGEGLSYSKHSAVIAAFGRHFARTKRIPVKFHRYLIDAERIRLRADYNTDLDITEADVDEILAHGQEMLDFALAHLDSLPPHSS
ncbi:HEPN domain-containing protein [Phormidium yuhuli AB48]|uniref:HEPN domain-containing protein n=1 Tax=Phormidium yuhuli AB48 TaxID=2940671 RepID=A0ABY5AQB0_9CYAN|nr:HEPN domain-containing protein [Phormidium yuhuli]USR91409.1 HEPN domain-containing protein [Phormidium yuhuli AB48]